MHERLKRHAIQVLRAAGHKQTEIAKQLGVSERSVRTIEDEPALATVDDTAEPRRRRIGQPSKAKPFREAVLAILKKTPS